MMEDLGKRGALTYCGLSVAIFFMDNMMIANGAASVSNPGWLLISTLYQLFKWSWWLLLGAAVILSLLWLKFFIAEQIQISRSQRRESERQKYYDQQTAQGPDQESINRNIRERAAEEKKAEEERQKSEAILRETIRQEKLKSRTADDAIDEALQDFF